MSEKLSEYTDGLLSGKALEQLELHLDGCEACTTELEQLRATVDLLRQTEQVSAPRSFAIDPATAGWPDDLQRYGDRALRWLRPALAVSAILFVVMLCVDFIAPATPAPEVDGPVMSAGGFDWRAILRIFEWGWGVMVLAFVIAFIYVSWRRRRGYHDRDDFNDLLH